MASSFRKAQVPIRDRGRNSCPNHRGKELTFICEDCSKVAICKACVSTIHKEHVVTKLSNLIPSAKQEVISSVKKAERFFLPRLREEIVSVDSKINEAKKYFKDITQQIQTIADKMVASCHELENQNFSLLIKHKEEIRSRIQSLGYEVQKRNELLQSGTPLQLYEISRYTLDDTDNRTQSNLPGAELQPNFIIDKLEAIMTELCTFTTRQQQEMKLSQDETTAAVEKESPVEVVVLYDYEANDIDELTLAVGEIIKNVKMEEDGWWKGELNGKIGKFPSNFVQVIRKYKCSFMRKKKTVDVEVLFDYEADQIDELTIEVGNIIRNVKRVEDEWWEGELNGKIGIFPSNFVKVIEIDETSVLEKEETDGQPEQYHQPPTQQYNPPSPQYVLQPQQNNPQPQSDYKPRAPGRPESSGPIYRAMYDYNAEDSDEVSFMEEDIIINTQIIDDGWMEGTVRRTGLSGLLPSNYVEKV